MEHTLQQRVGTRLIGALALVALVAACDESGVFDGIASLGPDFVRIFNQDPNDEPIQLDGINMWMKPQREPFNP